MVTGLRPQIVFFVSFKYASNCLFRPLVILCLDGFDAVQIKLVYRLPRVLVSRVVGLVLETLSPVAKVRRDDKKTLVVLEIRQQQFTCDALHVLCAADHDRNHRSVRIEHDSEIRILHFEAVLILVIFL